MSAVTLQTQPNVMETPEARWAARYSIPRPVARYFRAALPDRRSATSRIRMTQRGEFLMDPDRNRWSPFEASEILTTHPPGFVWDARIRVAQGLSVHVTDSFHDGEGAMRATFMGLLRLASVHGTPDIAKGALHRYLAEAVLLPPALLPRNGVLWSPLDEDHARATLEVGATTVSLDFRFGPDGLVSSVHTPARMRDVNGHGVPTPWQGRWWGYEECEGMLVPHRGEVEWLLPNGAQPYWRGHIASVEFS